MAKAGEADRSFLAAPHPGIFRVTLDVPIPGLGHVHTYIAEGVGGGLVVIDTSLGYDDSFQRIESAIAFLGRKITDIESIVLTHSHPDHIGLCAQLQQASNAPVVCHPIAQRNFHSIRDRARWDSITKLYKQHGYSDPTRLPMFLPFDIPEVFADIADTFELCGKTWEVLHTPGHESGHIVFFEPTSRVLIAGDAILASITPHVGYYLDSEDPLSDFLTSLELIGTKNPALVLAGHGRRFTNGAERAQTIQWHHQRRLRQILETLNRDGASSAMAIANSLFGSLNSFTMRLAVSETLSHLEHLRLDDRIARQVDDAGFFMYERAN